MITIIEKRMENNAIFSPGTWFSSGENIALKVAEGKYFIFQDPYLLYDDEYVKNYVRIRVELEAHFDCFGKLVQLKNVPPGGFFYCLGSTYFLVKELDPVNLITCEAEFMDPNTWVKPVDLTITVVK